MSKIEYDICMKTPIGSRYGKMRVAKEQDKLSGLLDVLKQPEAFEGEIDGNGNCTLYGKLVTLMQTIPYVATGTMSADTIFLTLQSGQSTFEINGVACYRETERKPL